MAGPCSTSGNETRDAAGFLGDHLSKVDLFPDAVCDVHPKERDRGLPRGATVVDFAYAIHSSDWPSHHRRRKINDEEVPPRTEHQER